MVTNFSLLLLSKKREGHKGFVVVNLVKKITLYFLAKITLVKAIKIIFISSFYQNIH